MNSRNGSSAPGGSVSPAAIAWPPPAISRPLSLAASTAAPRSTPEIERPEPLPLPSSPSAMTMAGRPKRSLMRPATMPITPGCQPRAHDRQDRRAVEPGRLALGLLAHQHLDRAALLVEPVELGGDGARFLGVGRGQQSHAKVGLADAPAGVDPRAEREAEVAAARRFHQPRRLGKRGEADILPRGHDLEALRDERAVEALEPRDVGDGAERDQIEQVDDLGLGLRFEDAAAAKLAQQRDAEQERHSDRREMAMRRAVRALVEAVGVDQRMRQREQARALVVIDDDHVEPGIAASSSASNAWAPQSTHTAMLAPRALSSTSALPDGP